MTKVLLSILVCSLYLHSFLVFIYSQCFPIFHHFNNDLTIARTNIQNPAYILTFISLLLFTPIIIIHQFIILQDSCEFLLKTSFVHRINANNFFCAHIKLIQQMHKTTRKLNLYRISIMMLVFVIIYIQHCVYLTNNQVFRSSFLSLTPQELFNFN